MHHIDLKMARLMMEDRAKLLDGEFPVMNTIGSTAV